MMMKGSAMKESAVTRDAAPESKKMKKKESSDRKELEKALFKGVAEQICDEDEELEESKQAMPIPSASPSISSLPTPAQPGKSPAEIQFFSELINSQSSDGFWSNPALLSKICIIMSLSEE